MGAEVEVRLPVRASPRQVSRLCALVCRQLADGGARQVVCDVDPLAADVGVVEALARLALTARRGGATFVVRGASQHLRSLLRLVGLDDALPATSGHASLPKGCPGPTSVRTVSDALIALSSRGTP